MKVELVEHVGGRLIVWLVLFVVVLLLILNVMESFNFLNSPLSGAKFFQPEGALPSMDTTRYSMGFQGLEAFLRASNIGS